MCVGDTVGGSPSHNHQHVPVTCGPLVLTAGCTRPPPGVQQAQVWGLYVRLIGRYWAPGRLLAGLNS